MTRILVIFDGLTSLKLLRYVLVAMGIIHIYLLINRYIQSDENWFGEQAYWLLHEGKVKLKSLPYILDWENEFLVYHKLFVWIGYLIIIVVGWNVYYFKTFVLITFLSGLFIISKYLRYHNQEVLLFTFMITLMVPMLFLRSFEFRPEVPIMTLGFGSFYALSCYKNRGNYIYIVLAAILAASCFLLHLNGVIYCLSAVVVLVYYKKWRACLLFSIVAVPITAIYFAPLVMYDQLNQWVFNLKHWPSHDFEEGTNAGVLTFLFSLLNRLASEHQRFFWGDQVIGISALFMIILLIKLKFLWNNYKFLTLYTFLNILFLGLLGSHKAAQYLVFHVPYMAILISLAIFSLKKENKPWLKMLVLAAIFTHCLMYIKTAHETFKRNQPHGKIHNELATHLEKGSSVISHWEFIFNEIDNFEIYSYKSYEYLQETKEVPFTQEEVLIDLKKRQVDYVIIDSKMKVSSDLPWFKNWEINENPYYYKFKELHGYLILKRKY